MMEYKEDDFLMLSGVQHYIFCRRQWALIHIEQQWSENYLTTDGNIMHQKAHDGLSFEKRKGILISRGMPIRSYKLGISGICDVVEFHESNKGIALYGKNKKYKIHPVEYKRGKSKEDDSDILQVVAQALCLEEMLCCDIDTGYLYYGETRRREIVEINETQRSKIKAIFEEMHELHFRGYTPKAKSSKKCKACSLIDICIPKISKGKSVKGYIDRMLEES